MNPNLNHCGMILSGEFITPFIESFSFMVTSDVLITNRTSLKNMPYFDFHAFIHHLSHNQETISLLIPATCIINEIINLFSNYSIRINKGFYKYAEVEHMVSEENVYFILPLSESIQ